MLTGKLARKALATTATSHPFISRQFTSSRMTSSAQPQAGPWTEVWNKALNEMKEASTYKRERIIVTPQSSGIEVADPSGRRAKVLNFCANNYLGLADNKSIMEASKKMTDSHGFGLSSVRFICGTQVRLEFPIFRR
jgi:glycine C-acetyltransferase